MQSDNQRLKERILHRLSNQKPEDPSRALIFGAGVAIAVIVGGILAYAFADRIDEYFTFRRQLYLLVIIGVLAVVIGGWWFVRKIKS